jgi:hypothetical protein
VPPLRERLAARWPLALGVGVLLALGLEGLVTLAAPIQAYDEGIPLVESMRLARGELPWRDYEPAYGPLEAALLLPFTWTVGPELIGLRLVRVLAAALTAVAAAGCARRLGGSALGSAGVGLVVVAFIDPLIHPVIAPVLASALALELGRGPRAAAGCVAAGALAGLAGLFRPEFGGLAAGAAIVTLLARPWLAREGDEPPTARGLGLVLAGGAPAALVLLGLVLAASPERVLAYTRELRGLLPYRELPYPFPPPLDRPLPTLVGAVVLFLTPLVVAALAPVGLVAGLAAARRDATLRPRALELHLTLLAVGLLPYAFMRADYAHVLPAFAASAPLVAAAAARIMARLGPPSARVQRLAFALVLAPLVVRPLTALWLLAREPLVVGRLPALRGLLVPPEDEQRYAELRAAVDAHAPTGAPVWVGTAVATAQRLGPEHRRVVLTDLLVYSVLRRPPATRHVVLQPGITTTEAKQRQLVADLEARATPVVVLARGTWRDEPNRSQEFGARTLDGYLSRRYAAAEDVGRWVVLARRP